MEREIYKRLYGQFEARYAHYNQAVPRGTLDLYYASYVQSDTVYLVNRRHVMTDKMFADKLGLGAYAPFVGDTRVSLERFVEEYMAWFRERAQSKCRDAYPAMKDEYSTVREIRELYNEFAEEYRQLFQTRNGIEEAVRTFTAAAMGIKDAKMRGKYLSDATYLREEVLQLQYETLMIAAQASDVAYMTSTLSRLRNSEIVVYGELIKRWELGMSGITDRATRVEQAAGEDSKGLGPGLDEASAEKAREALNQVIGVLAKGIGKRKKFIDKSSEYLRDLTDNAARDAKISEIDRDCRRAVRNELDHVCYLAGSVFIEVFVATATLQEQAVGYAVPDATIQEMLPTGLTPEWGQWTSPRAVARLFEIWKSPVIVAKKLEDMFHALSLFYQEELAQKTRENLSVVRRGANTAASTLMEGVLKTAIEKAEKAKNDAMERARTEKAQNTALKQYKSDTTNPP